MGTAVARRNSILTQGSCQEDHIQSAFSLRLLKKDVISESCAISYYSVKSDMRGHSLALTALGTLAQ